jgi:hypothetical protein
MVNNLDIHFYKYMNEDSIPILKKAYELYKIFHSYRKLIPKHDRYSVYERSENIMG